MIRLVVADDHAIVRAGVRALLAGEEDMRIVAEAGDGFAAVAAVIEHGPDVLLIDLSMPGCNGVEAISRVRGPGMTATAARTRVLVLSMHGAPEYVRPALRAGADGYVVKGSGLDDLVRAIRVVAGGARFLGREAQRLVAADALEPLAGPDELLRLTPREREVVQLVAEGRTNKEIGALLHLSPKTVDTHRTNLMRKLDLHDVQSLTRFALRHRLISGEP